MDDLRSHEKLSIRDSARSLKKYGSTSKHVMRNQNFVKHVVTSTDTLQGIALKYGVTMEQVRRVNRLWASDSLFLREYLMIPVTDNGSLPSSIETVNVNSHSEVTSPTDLEEDDLSKFLIKIDSSIANTKEEVRKARGNSEFASNLEVDYNNEGRKKPAVSRMKQTVNNNSFSDLTSTTTTTSSTPQTIVVSHGRKLRSSLQRLEQQQDELFEL